ncbi:MAG: hypothetical protein JRH17_25465, partial [Deltaproteobacteria bacterium]|nr:hypothetical protein [Deltaproteobacteria bacterium]
WRITVPIYIAYGTIAISVGSLSERLHRYYNRILQNERTMIDLQLKQDAWPPPVARDIDLEQARTLKEAQ